MNKRARPKSPATTNDRRGMRQRFIPALIAGGACGLGMTPAEAIQLGEIDVHSSLGQPLRASIAYALSANEQIGDYCIFLRRAPSGSGLPALSQARLTVANGRINIAGDTPIREPMLGIGLTVNCPYTPHLSRSYTVLLDPFVASSPAQAAQPTAAPAPVEEPAPVTARRQPVARTSQPAPVARQQAAERAATAQPIDVAGEYRVQVGDSLSEIAARLQNRPVGLWTAVDMLFAANPDAFIDGDINKLKAGSLLTIPSFDGVNAPVVSAAVVSPAAVQPAAAESATAYGGFDGARDTVEDTQPSLQSATAGTANQPETVVAPSTSTVEPAIAEPTTTETLDTEVTADNAFVTPLDIEVSDGVPIVSDDAGAAVTADDDARGSNTTLYWLAGTGLALILLLLAFGRRLRGRPDAPLTPEIDDVPAANDNAAESPHTQTETATEEALGEVDFDIGVQPSTEHAVALDADLSAGTGLQQAGEIEVAQDFGFSTTQPAGGELDLTLTEDTTIQEKQSTDILPAHRVAENTILEKEILPSDADDDYDMSVIVDATKQKFGEGDITAKDLMAVALAETDDEQGDDEYTLSREVDYKILEQDYEDELTATQALNAEIEKAAKELAERIDEEPAADQTSETLAITAETEAIVNAEDEHEILTELDDTGVNEELTAAMPQRGVSSVADATSELPAPEGDAQRSNDDTAANTEITEKLPAAENDPTAEMDIETGHFRSKRSG